MNEKKFSKKLNEMTPEENERKEALWQQISLESGIDVGVKKPFSLRLAMSLAMCVLVLCIAVPLLIVNLGKPTQQAGGSMTSGNTSFTSILPDDDPNRFRENEYIYVPSPKTIEEIAKNDSNVLYVKDWKRDKNATSFIQARGTDRVIGILDNSKFVGILDNSVDTKDYNVSVKILYEDISIVSIEKEIENMITGENVNGVDISWRSKDTGCCASFVYNKYTYFIEIDGGTSSGKVALNAAKTLLQQNK